MKKVLAIAALMLLTSVVSVSAQQRRRNFRRQMVKKEMALQLYSIRDLIGNPEKYAQNHVSTLKELAKMGYTAVEAANYDDGKLYGVSPEQYKKDCEAAGLKPISSHATRGLSDEEIANHDFKDAMKWWKKCIETHKAAGMEYIVSPWTNFPKDMVEAKTICDYHNEIGRMCKEAGLKYGYHNHSGEFKKIGDSDKLWYDYFLENTNPEYVFFQMDVYWTIMGQKAPVHYFKKYPGRFKMHHIKDVYELGESGFVGFDAIFGASKLSGLENYVVELEGTDGTIDDMEGVRRSAEYLYKSHFVRPSYSK